MKEAIGSASLFNIIITFVLVMILLFTGSIMYSKAFKVKNKIVEEIERHKTFDKYTVNDIEVWLEEIGYKQDSTGFNNCPDYSSDGFKKLPNAETKKYYRYCVYQKETCDNDVNDKDNCGVYYKVVAYMYLELPLVGDITPIPVVGETMTFRQIHNIEDGVNFERNNN